MIYLTPDQIEVYNSDKSFILVTGDRRTGKSLLGSVLAINSCLSKPNSQAYIIVPIFRDVINIKSTIIDILGKDKDCIEFINMKRLFIRFKNGSDIRFILPQEIFTYEFKGYKKPDFIFIEEISVYDKKESKRLFSIIKDNYYSRSWNCKFYISYNPMRRLDRCRALYRIAGFNKNWFKKRFFLCDYDGVKNDITIT